MKNGYSKKYIFLCVMLVFVSLAGLQALYHLTLQSEKNALEANIKSLFSDHKNLINPYHLSQSISNIESFSVLRCSRLIKIKPNNRTIVFIDLSFKQTCEESGFLFSGIEFETSYKAANGENWLFKGFIKSSVYMKIAFWTMRLLSMFTIVAVFLFYKQKAFAYQKELEIQHIKHQRYIDIVNTTQNISHDLKGPIGIIERLLEEVDANLSAKYKPALFRLQTMASSLKDADIDSLVRDEWIEFTAFGLINELKLMHKNTDILLFEHITGKIKMDADKIERSISNLIFNAIEAGATKVECATITDDGDFVITVTDNGPGVPDAIKNKIFDRGFSANKPSGTGLGLNFVQTTARGHGGEVSYNRNGNYSEFKIVIPNVVTFEESNAPTFKPEPKSRPTRKITENHKKILLAISDHERLKEMTKALSEVDLTTNTNDLEHCSFIFTDDIELMEQCLHLKKRVLFDSGLPDETVIGRIKAEI